MRRAITCSAPAVPLQSASVSCCDDPDCTTAERTDQARATLSGAGPFATHLTLACESPVRVRRRPLRGVPFDALGSRDSPAIPIAR